MNRKILSLLLALFLVAALGLTGCKSEETGIVEGGEGFEEDVLPDEAPVEMEPEDIALDAEMMGTGGVIEVINSGFSTKEFTADAVSDGDLELILQSGANAPSARNTQPWHFTVVESELTAKELVPIATAGTKVIVISGPSDPDEGVDVSFDCGLATQNMYLAAQSLGMGAHIYTGPVRTANEYGDLLELPEGYEAVAILCVGYIENYTDAVSGASSREALETRVNYASAVVGGDDGQGGDETPVDDETPAEGDDGDQAPEAGTDRETATDTDGDADTGETSSDDGEETAE